MASNDTDSNSEVAMLARGEKSMVTGQPCVFDQSLAGSNAQVYWVSD